MADWKKNPLVIVGAGAVLILAAVFTIISLQPQKKLYHLKCANCNTEFDAKLPVTTVFPITCPSCGQKTAYRTVKMKCNACGQTFVRIEKPHTTSKEGNLGEGVAHVARGADEEAKCPLCGVVGQLEKIE